MNYARFFNLLLLANRDSIKSQIEKKQIDRNRSRFDLYRLYDEVHEKAAPCFVLSTGRCGTMLLDKIFNKHSQIRSFHEPSPELVYFSKYAYIHHADHDDQLRMLVDGARYDVIRDSYMLDKMYTETNNRITFFAYQLTTLYPRARFVHLVRHPFRFIESGLKRQWYSGIHLHDEGRIVPADPKAVGWEKIERIEKIAWLFCEKSAGFISFWQFQPSMRFSWSNRNRRHLDTRSFWESF